MEQKISLLTLGLSQIPDIVALQLTVDGSDLPILVTDQDFSQHLADAGLDPVETLRTPARGRSPRCGATARYGELVPRRIEATGDWLATVALPLRTELAGRAGDLLGADRPRAARRPSCATTPSPAAARSPSSTPRAARCSSSTPRMLADRAIVANAAPLIVTSARPEAIEGYVRPDGQAMLGAYAFPEAFPWAIVTELSEESAYAVVNHMLRNLLLVGLAGFGVAAAAALFFAGRLTGPILRIGGVAARVGAGDLSARVEGVRTRDEIGDLAGRMNAMIRQLSERLELMKFVSRGTVTAIRAADAAGRRPRRRAAPRRGALLRHPRLHRLLRGGRARGGGRDAEQLPRRPDRDRRAPRRRRRQVHRRRGGRGVPGRRTWSATRSPRGLEIQRALADLLEAHPEWNLHVGVGIAAGEVVMGAIGSRDRLDFTVLGGVVNLASRLCAAAPPDAILVSGPVRDALAGEDFVAFAPLPPIELKGLAAPVTAFAAYAAGSRRRGRLRPEKPENTHMDSSTDSIWFLGAESEAFSVACLAIAELRRFHAPFPPKVSRSGSAPGRSRP